MDRNLKKRMILVIVSILALLLVLAITVNLLTKCSVESGGSTNGGNGTSKETVQIEFSTEYITDEAVLLSDEKYMGYDRNIYYLNSQTGVTVGLTAENYGDYGEATKLLCDLIEAIIAGDAETYNSFFSEKYFESNTAQETFSMQKLYDIKITKTDESPSEDKTYTEYIYALDYRIRRNNGSLRSDIDSDGSRTQYFLITNREGTLLIDKVVLAP